MGAKKQGLAGGQGIWVPPSGHQSRQVRISQGALGVEDALGDPWPRPGSSVTWPATTRCPFRVLHTSQPHRAQAAPPPRHHHPPPPPRKEEQIPSPPPQLSNPPPTPSSGHGRSTHLSVADNVTHHSSQCVTNIPLDGNYFLIKTKKNRHACADFMHLLRVKIAFKKRLGDRSLLWPRPCQRKRKLAYFLHGAQQACVCRNRIGWP